MAGLLDFYTDPRAMGLLGIASGLLQAGGPQRFPVSTGQAIGSSALQGAQLAQQTQAFKSQQALQNEQLQALQLNNALLGGKAAFFAGGAPAPAPANPMVPGLPTSSVMAGGGSYVPQAVPQPAPQGGAAGLPTIQGLTPELSRAAALGWLSPGYVSAIASQNKPISGRAGAPLWGLKPDGTYGIVGFSPKLPEGATMGENGVQLAPNYAQTVTELGSIPNPSAPMQTVKLSNGQELQLTQPEYIQYTQSGGTVLPSRYSSLRIPGIRFGDAPQSMPSPAAPAAPAAPMAPQRSGQAEPPPLVGATQSQSEQVTQARQTAAGKAVDEQFAKDYVAFTTGGAQDAAKQLAQLRDVQAELRNPKANLTGPVIGSTPDYVKKFTNPQSIAMRERVEEVVQRSLRAILGAQFTENEGVRLIARAYNPNLPEKENAVRVGRLFTQLEQAFKQKQAAAQYFEKNGTLEGWKGKLPTITDFNPEGSSSRANQEKVPSGVDPRLWSVMTPQERALWQQ